MKNLFKSSILGLVLILAGCDNYDYYKVGDKVKLKGVNINAYICDQETNSNFLRICYIDSSNNLHKLVITDTSTIEKIIK